MSNNIIKGEDGKYRWVYEYNMYKNPTILFTIWKIFLIILVAIFGFVALSSLMTQDGFPKSVGEIAKTFALVGAILFVLSTLSYFILACIYGGKYCVVFEMDEEGIMHTQLEKQFKKAQVLGLITTLAASGTLKGIGLNTMTHSCLYSQFSKVRKIKEIRRRNTIKLNAPFSKNQVYCQKEDYDFVAGFIKEHVNNK